MAGDEGEGKVVVVVVVVVCYLRVGVGLMGSHGKPWRNVSSVD